MSNPFFNRFDGECQRCGNSVSEGDKMFADDGDFICEQCAFDGGNVCECGNYKKSQYDTCYDHKAPEADDITSEEFFKK